MWSLKRDSKESDSRRLGREATRDGKKMKERVREGETPKKNGRETFTPRERPERGRKGKRQRETGSHTMGKW